MKKPTLFLAVFLLKLTVSFSQKKETFKIFKFHPFSLITGSMNVSQEVFNEKMNRSTVVMLGLRYVKNSSTNTYNSSPVEQFNNWKGVALGLERRFYVPSFKTGENNRLFNEKSHYGIYLSTGLRLDYNINDYEKGGYNTIQDPANPTIYKNQFVNNSGKISYLGVMPNMNLGVQFTLFQNLYIDTYIGGGIRFMQKNIIKQKIDNFAYTYYYGNGIQSGAVENFVIKEGVQPNFGFTLGIRI